MKLESLTLEVRPRTPWESMDVAVRLAATHWRLLFSSWMVSVFPLFVIINIILLEDHPYWAFFIIWLLKPLYDRVPLFVLSRVIFSEKTSWQDVISAVPSFFKTGIFSSLTLYRLDPSRSFGLPVRQLEGLKGKSRRQRMHTLSRAYNNREVLFFILCAHLESLISLGLIGLALMMLPADIAVQNAESLFMDEEPGLISNIMSMILYFFVMMIVEILYVSGGFVLYLNRRTILEGWDIELVFRKLSKRVALQKQHEGALVGDSLINNNVKSILVILFSSSLFLFGSGISQNAQAISQSASTAYEKILPPVSPQRLSPELSSETIKQVMESSAFNRFKQVETLEYTGEEQEDPDDLDLTRSWLTDTFETIGKTLAFLFEVLLWCIALAAIFLLVKYHKRLQFGFGKLFKPKEKAAQVPEMLFGLDVREESLPDDVAAQAMALHRKKDYRASLALLYRASLAYLVNSYDFTLARGATEGDCLKWVETKLTLPSNSIVSNKESLEMEKKYFAELTRAWQLTAYAHRFIPEEQMERLCLDWSRFYDKRADKPIEPQAKDTKGLNDE